MGITLACPKCRSQLNVRDDMAGLTGKCPKCGGALRVPARSRTSDAATPVVRSNSQTPTPAAGERQIRPTPRSSATGVSAWPLHQRREAVLSGFTAAAAPAPASLKLIVFTCLACEALLAAVLLLVIPASLVATAWHWWAHSAMLSASAAGACAYLAIGIAGIVFPLLLAKSLFGRKTTSCVARDLMIAEEPLLFQFLEQLCQAIQAPMPKTVRVDCGIEIRVEQRRGRFGMFSRDQILVIGLPLAAGLSLQEFAGVVASQLSYSVRGGPGRRSAYRLRALSRWFQKQVYERDAWDQRLLAWSRRSAVARIALLPVRGATWVARFVPLSLMAVGHALCSDALQRLEEDGDQLQAHVAGRQHFASACERRELLEYAYHGVQSDMETLRDEASLAENLPQLIVANIDELPEEVAVYILELLDKRRTQLLDPPTSMSERIAHASQSAAAIFRSPLATSVLFENFDQVCRQATLEHYRALLGPKFRPKALQQAAIVPAAAKASADHEDRSQCFLRALGERRTVRLPAAHVEPTANPELVQQQLVHHRQTMEREAADYRFDYQAYLAAEQQFLEMTKMVAVCKAGLQPLPALFAVPLLDAVTAKNRRTEARDRKRGLGARMEPFESGAGWRIHSALVLLHDSAVAAKASNTGALREEVDRLLPVVSAVGQQFDRLDSLRSDAAKLACLLGHARNRPPTAEVQREVGRRTLRVSKELAGLHDLFDHVDQPLDCSAGEISVALQILPKLPPAGNTAAALTAANDFDRKLIALYSRALGRLCTIAEQVEQALGLPPITG